MATAIDDNAADENQTNQYSSYLIFAILALGLATGSTPVGMYQQLIEWYKKGNLDFSKIATVNLDEYKGLSPDNDQSYRYFMDQNLLNHINIEKSHAYVPDGMDADSEYACKEYDKIISMVGGIDL